MIGTTYNTIKGGTLKVVSVKGNTYHLECSICSLDKELFKEPFTTSKTALRNGSRPCVCSLKGGYSWSEEQQTVRCKRACDSKGEVFLGFKDGTYKGSSKVIVKCSKGHTTDTRTVFGLLKGKTGCGSCVGSKISKSKSHDWVGKERVIGDATHKVKKFTSDKYLHYECSVCSLDKKLFPDLFRISRSDWKRKLTCGCGGQTRWTKEQFEVLCERAVQGKDGISFIGLSGEYKGCYTKVIQECSTHGRWDTGTVEKLIYCGRGCPTCASTEHPAGLYTKRLDEVDSLYLLRFTDGEGEPFIKVGRTFKLDTRLEEFRKFYTIEVLGIHLDLHKVIRPLEKQLHNHLYRYHYSPKIPFGGSIQECFREEALWDKDIIEVFNLNS